MKKAVITGASDGLGAELAQLLKGKGIAVVSASRAKPAEGIAHVALDLTDNASIESAAGEILEKHADADVLVNCAGALQINPLENIPFDVVDRVMAVNIAGMIKFTGKLIPLIKQNKGDIMNVGSSVGFKAYEGQAAYGASKWAVRGFTANLQLELAKTDVRVMCFSPGGFKSRLFEKATGKEADLSQYMDAKPLAQVLLSMLELPRNMQATCVRIDRKVAPAGSGD